METSVLILLALCSLLASAEELTVKAGKADKMVLLPPGPPATLLTSQAHVDRSSYGGGEQTILASAFKCEHTLY